MKLLFFFLFLIVSLPGLCQEENSPDPSRPQDLPQRVHVLGNPQPQQPDSPSQEVNNVPSSDDDELLEKLEEDRKKQVEMAIKMDQSTQEVTEKIFNAPEELRKLGYSSLDGASLMDKRVVEIVRRSLKESPLRNASDKEVRSLILEKANGNAIGKYLMTHPKVMDTIVELLKDEKALPSAVGIFIRKEDLKLYFYIWLGIVLLTWMIKKFYVRKQTNWSRLQTILVSMLISLAATFVSLTTFYNMFYEELSPTTKILVKHWRKRNL